MDSFQDLAARLTIPGLPEWSGVAALIALLLVALAYLLMPFSVFGVKGRLDALEAQLDEIRDEIRGLSIRLSDAPRRAGGGAAAEDWVDPPPRAPQGTAASQPRASPPIPPPASWPDPPRGGRPEPRLDWPTRR
jgi:hypothetical protein